MISLSQSRPYKFEHYSQLTRDEIFKLGHIFELDFRLFRYGFPGSLKLVLRNTTTGEERRFEQLKWHKKKIEADRSGGRPPH